MTSSAPTFRQRLHDFFYAPESPYALALMRIALPLVMATMMVPRWPVAREIYSTDGATAPLALGYGIPNMLPEFSGPVAVAICSLLLFTMATSCIGLCTRVSLLVTCVLYTYLCLLDAVSTMTKYSVITTHLLILLACSGCGAVWSVDAWLSRRTGGLPAAAPEFPVWPRRLIQLLIGCIYFGAAITKINTPTFLSGDQLHFWMLTHINFRHPVGEWLSLYPVILKSMSYVTLVWEIVFIFLVWKPMFRPWVLAMGVLFHFLTVVTLGLMIFPMVCYTTYLAFLEPDDMRQVAGWMSARLQRYPFVLQSVQRVRDWVAGWGDPTAWRTPARAGFVVAATLAAVGGVEAEYWLDPYGERRPEGRHQLKPLDPEFAQRLLQPTQPIRDVDKFFAIDAGTMLVGDLLVDRRRAFRHGEKMIIQCNLTPPHEDMWIECKILDPENRLVDRLGNVAPREAFRTNFVYDVTSALLPGDYTLVIQNAGRDVMRKRVRIEGAGQTASAN